MVHRQLPGQADNPEDKKQDDGRIDPVPEKVAGTVYPYRGMEQHGVKQPEDMPIRETGEYTLGPDEFYNFESLPEEKEPEPVPVRIVTTAARVRKSYRVSRYTSTELAGSLVGRKDSRTRLLIRSATSNTGIAWVSNSMELANPVFGWGLDAGSQLEMFSTEQVFVCSESGETQSLYVMEEFEIEL